MPRRVAPPPPDPADGDQPLASSSRGMPQKSPPNAILVAICSFFLPGLGQVIAGQALKGLVLMATFVFTCGGLGVLSFIAAADAFVIAGRLERGEDVGPWKFF
jgi:TM2 domain-containing membrane protein YozV